MAAVLKAVEGDLLTLSAEARRAVPAVKEAAERAIYDLRGLQRTAGGGGTGGGAAGGDPFAALPPEKLQAVKTQWLHPFLFACNHVDAPRKVLVVALTAVQRLVTCDGVAAGDMPSIARVLEIQVGTPARGAGEGWQWARG